MYYLNWDIYETNQLRSTLYSMSSQLLKKRRTHQLRTKITQRINQNSSPSQTSLLTYKPYPFRSRRIQNTNPYQSAYHRRIPWRRTDFIATQSTKSQILVQILKAPKYQAYMPLQTISATKSLYSFTYLEIHKAILNRSTCVPVTEPNQHRNSLFRRDLYLWTLLSCQIQLRYRF